MGDCFYFNWPQEENAESSLAENAGSSVRFPGQLGLPWPLPVEDRAASASKSHSLAEKRRRDRINAHLATLRKLIPKSDKMDKAALLGSVIDRVKDLKKEATEASDKASTLPTEVDEVAIDFLGDKQQKEGILIRASVCCDDRPEVFGELIRALKGLRLRFSLIPQPPVKTRVLNLETKIYLNRHESQVEEEAYEEIEEEAPKDETEI